MQGKDRLYRWVFQDALRHHEASATRLTLWCPFLSRLEDEPDASFDLLAEETQHFGDAQTNGGVDIMTAGVFDPLFLDL